jgi:hypothetical protein
VTEHDVLAVKIVRIISLLSSLGRTELAGQRDENRRNPERIDDHDQRDKRLQGKLQEAFIYVG